jgi:hypothetical protein
VVQSATGTSISAVGLSNIESRAADILRKFAEMRALKKLADPFASVPSSGVAPVPRAWITPKSVRPLDPNMRTLMRKVHESNLNYRQSIIRKI